MVSKVPTLPSFSHSQVAQAILGEADATVAKHGKISEKQMRGLMKRAWNGKAQAVDANGAAALAMVHEKHQGKMDAGAAKLSSTFARAYHSDAMESPYLKQLRQASERQQAQAARNFEDFMERDAVLDERQETRAGQADQKDVRLDYGAFKEDLKENRVETSEWQASQLFLQRGIKKRPITN